MDYDLGDRIPSSIGTGNLSTVGPEGDSSAFVDTVVCLTYLGWCSIGYKKCKHRY